MQLCCQKVPVFLLTHLAVFPYPHNCEKIQCSCEKGWSSSLDYSGMASSYCSQYEQVLKHLLHELDETTREMLPEERRRLLHMKHSFFLQNCLYSCHDICTG